MHWETWAGILAMLTALSLIFVTGKKFVKFLFLLRDLIDSIKVNTAAHGSLTRELHEFKKQIIARVDELADDLETVKDVVFANEQKVG